MLSIDQSMILSSKIDLHIFENDFGKIEIKFFFNFQTYPILKS